MPIINKAGMRDWNDGDVMHQNDYEAERNLIIDAINNIYDNKLSLAAGGSISLTPGANGLITVSVTLASNAVNTAAITDGAVTVAKLDPAILLSSNDPTYNIHKGAAVLDHPDQSVTTAKIKDQNVTTIKLADANVTLAKLAQDVQDTISMMQCLQWMEVNP